MGTRFPRIIQIAQQFSLAAVLVVLLTALTHSHNAWAQVTSETHGGSPISFNIPAQSLTSALNAFAETSGLQVSYPAEMANGLSSSAVTGNYLPGEALGVLLSGTGLTYRFTNATTVTLVQGFPTSTVPVPVELHASSDTPSEISANQQKPIKVPEIVVKDVRERKDTSYAVDEVSSATRMPVPVHDIPRSVETVTRQVIEDQKVLRLNDALRNVSGMGQTDPFNAAITIRGFLTTNNFFKNGFRDDGNFSSIAPRDVLNIETIEVVKGPPSFLYGRADPGGIINQITKAPLRNSYYSAEMVLGNYDLYRPQMDIGGPLNASKTLTYRFNAMYESAGSYREGVRSQRIFIAPTIGWEIGPRTTFRFEGEYFYDNSVVDRGLVAIGGAVAPIPITRFLGDPTRTNETNHGKATLTFLHDFNDMFRWRTGFRAAVTRGLYSSRESWFLVGNETDGILNLAQFHIPTTAQSHILQNELHGKFATGPIKHKTIVGVEIGREVETDGTATDNPNQDTGTPGQFSYINIFNPADRLFLNTPLVKISDERQVNNFLGFYFGDHMSLLENLHLHAGGRFDYFKQHLTVRPVPGTPTQSEDSQTDLAFSPSIGLTYQPWKPIALFGNYTESFAPQQAGTRNFAGTLFNPERGKAYEAGIKFQFFENRLRAKVAGFHITKTNVLTLDPINGFPFSVATGEQRSQGVEFDIAGRILPGWDIIANYAYVDIRVSEDNTFSIGSRVPNIPLNQGSLWTTYFIQDGPFKGLGAGIGMFAQGKRKGVNECTDPSNCSAQVDLQGFARMDAAVYYRKPEIFPRTNLLAALNFTNLLDQRYFAGTLDIREVIYTGAPFTVIGSVKLEYY